jgi:hypothetical protein
MTIQISLAAGTHVSKNEIGALRSMEIRPSKNFHQGFIREI